MFRSNRFERKGCATLEIMVTRSLRRIYLHIYIHKFVIKSILVDNNASNSIVARAVINSFSWPLVRFEVFFFFSFFPFFFLLNVDVFVPQGRTRTAKRNTHARFEG